MSGERDGASAARRRRERRLRSWWRHEQQCVRMALTAATHHSGGRRDVRRSMGKEDGQRREAAGSLEGSWAAVGGGSHGRLCGCLGSSPSLADAAGDAVDGESIRFLLWGALKTPEQVEAAKQASLRRQRKAAAKKEKEMAEKDVAASSSQRRRKKRRFIDKVVFVVAQRVIPIHCRFRQWHVHGWFCWYFNFLRTPFCCRQARDARHHGQHGPEGQLRSEMLAALVSEEGFHRIFMSWWAWLFSDWWR